MAHLKNKTISKLGGSPGLVVMGDYSCSRGQGVWISAPYTGWAFFTLICCENSIVCLKRSKINEKEAGVDPFFKKIFQNSFEISNRRNDGVDEQIWRQNLKRPTARIEMRSRERWKIK